MKFSDCWVQGWQEEYRVSLKHPNKLFAVMGGVFAKRIIRMENWSVYGEVLVERRTTWLDRAASLRDDTSNLEVDDSMVQPCLKKCVDANGKNKDTFAAMHGIGEREKRPWGQNRRQENVNSDSSDTGFSDSESDMSEPGPPEENKNECMLAFLDMLVHMVFRKLSFLMAGHTHEDIRT
ncbi:hypothetical protein Bbelb_334210 [Branchiostoma belcheri]|nr:hypothetical protein Bbelb_334210 [Branchiostoma belcheri]